MNYIASTEVSSDTITGADTLAHWLRVGAACTAIRDDAKAVAAYRQAHLMAPDDIEARAGLAEALSRCGKFGAAASMCIQGLRAAPEEGRLYRSVGHILDHAGLSEQADRMFLLARSRMPAPGPSAWRFAWQTIRRSWSNGTRLALSHCMHSLPRFTRHGFGVTVTDPTDDNICRFGYPNDQIIFPDDWHHAFHIGIAWTDEAAPAPALAELLTALAGVPGTRFVNLHAHSGTPAVEGVRWDENAEPTVTTTVHLLRHLDLIICTDCDTAALAAVLGCPAWIFLPARNQEQAHWLFDTQGRLAFPRVRVFRPSPSGQWSPVLQQIRASLLRMLCKAAAGMQLTWTEQTLLRASIALADQRHAEAEHHYVELLAASDPLTEEVVFALHAYLRSGRNRHHLLSWLELRRAMAAPEEIRWLNHLRGMALGGA